MIMKRNTAISSNSKEILKTLSFIGSLSRKKSTPVRITEMIAIMVIFFSMVMVNVE